LQRLIKNIRKTLPEGDIKLSRPAGCDRIQLGLFNPKVLNGPLNHKVAQAVVERPAYWSFCWASGQVLANFILENPQWVVNKLVVDFGCGSGIVAIAAAIAGARKVIACDCDTDALDAASANARENGVKLELCDDLFRLPEVLDTPIDLITASDVLYDRDNWPFLAEMKRMAKEVILADSRIKEMFDASYQLLSRRHARTWPDLNEFDEFNTVRIYRAIGEA
jgi:predicted nicotinamide N-methyase